MYPSNKPLSNDPTLAGQEPVDENRLHSVLSQTQDHAQQALEQARQHAGEAAGNVQDALGQVRDHAGEAAGNVQDALGQVRDHVGEAAGNVQDTLGQVRDQAGDLAGKAQQHAGHIMNQAQDQAGHLAQELRQQLSQFLTAQKDQAARALGDIAQAALHISEQLRADGQTMLANAVASIAGHLQQFADNLHEKSLDQLVHDIEQGARVQTVLLLAGGIVLGLMSTRMTRTTKQA